MNERKTSTQRMREILGSLGDWEFVDQRGNIDDPSTGSAEATYKDADTQLILRLLRDRGTEHIDVGVYEGSAPPKFFPIELALALSWAFTRSHTTEKTIAMATEALSNGYDDEIDSLTNESQDEQREAIPSLDAHFDAAVLQKVLHLFDNSLKNLAEFIRCNHDSLENIASALETHALQKLAEVNPDLPP